MAKFNIPSNKVNRIKTASTGAFSVAPPSHNNALIKSTNANIPVTKNSQFAGSGANFAVTQPMFFSPFHTPQNWQIASKRREIYSWSYLPYSQVLTSNFTYSPIGEYVQNVYTNEIIEDIFTGGFLYNNIECEEILGATGEFRNPLRASKRDCVDKKCFEFNAVGNYRILAVSEEHPVIVLDGKNYRRKIKIEQSEIYRRKKNISQGTKRTQVSDKLIVRKEAQNVSQNDYLLSPIPQCGKVSIDSDLAWSIGLCIADGTIAKNRPGYDVSFTHDKGESHIQCLKNVLALNFSGKDESVQHGDGDGWRTKTYTKESHTLYSSYIEGKLTKKRFTKKVFELDKESRLSILAGYFDGDGSFSEQYQRLVANNYSCDMTDQLYWLLLSCGISCGLNKVPLYGEHYDTDSECCYRIIIPSSEVTKISSYMQSNKVPDDFVPKKQRQLRFLYTEDGVDYLLNLSKKLKK